MLISNGGRRLGAAPSPRGRGSTRRLHPTHLLIVTLAACSAPGTTAQDEARATSDRALQRGDSAKAAHQTGLTPAAPHRKPTTTTTTSPARGPAPRKSIPGLGKLRYAFPVWGCHTSYAHSHHDYPATDIFAPRACLFVAVVSGRVDEVTTTDTWSGSSNAGATRGGLSVSLIGKDGVRYYGSHLAAIAPGTASGTVVQAGQALGRVGDSGDARAVGTHVHFGISWPTQPGQWWVRRGELYPWPYLDSWRSGQSSSPAAAIQALEAQRGGELRCIPDC